MGNPDGAHLGYGAEQAMRAIVGGDDSDDSRMTVEMLYAKIEGAPDIVDEAQVNALFAALTSGGGYDLSATMAAKVILHFLQAHPESGTMPADSAYEWPRKENGDRDYEATPTVTTLGLYDYIEQTEPETRQKLRLLGLSGFQYGWAVNAARRCLELPPVPNPALLTIVVPDGDGEESEASS